MNIAPAIVNGIFYATRDLPRDARHLAGSAIVAIGGGGIGPMRAQWEKVLGRVEREAPQLRARAEAMTASPTAPASGQSPMTPHERSLSERPAVSQFVQWARGVRATLRAW